MCEDNGIFVKSQELNYELRSNLNLKLKKIVSFILILVLIFSTSILVRLPHFLSQDFFFDGDEAMIGIMARDFISGKGLPIYFYGQNYGLSTIEVLSTSIFIKTIGNSILALKLGGLLIFSFGLTFIWKTLIECGSSIFISVLVLLLLLLAPTWIMWSSFVRGGYVSAFMCISIIFYLTQVKNLNWKTIIITSFFSALAFEAQPLIFLPVLAFLIPWMFPIKLNIRKVIGFTINFSFIIAIIRYIGFNEAVWTSPTSNFFSFEQIDNLMIQLEGLVYAYSNFFYFTMNLRIETWWFVLLIVSLILIFLFLIIFIKKSNKSEKITVAIMILLLLTSAFLISTVSMYSPRYWLGFFTGILLIFIYSIIHSSSNLRKIFLLLIVLIYVSGLFVLKDIKRDWYDANVNELKSFNELYEYTKKNEFKAIYTIDALIQWKWNYLYGDEIPCTAFYEKERINYYRDKVLSYYNNNQNINVVIGYYNIYDGFNSNQEFSDGIERVNKKYFLRRNVTDQKIDSAFIYFR